jgi:hypothetical protein
MTVTDAMVAAARIAFRDAAVIRPGYDSIDYDVAMRAAIEAALAAAAPKKPTMPWIKP